MGALSPILRSIDRAGKLAFYCPGCRTEHVVRLKTHGGPHEWDGNAKAPTLTPSILYPGACHSFVTNGRIQFLGDCAHELAGQTVDLPPWPGADP
ncbi:hypothetical protein SAMN02745157_1480 [Kaistia soli DSM 19436]|uniref:Ammonia monooxygenase n=1 Tax=Kaistia soli DSM 19436 TaxID=1122133 RepID=A0A1M4YC24_9HYPH|nr:DUF6527 family protein [Kaistia soli]SHF03280.1 hypothetical protein SAMN02745157_1480 [Kaistia soli DSM 19436]